MSEIQQARDVLAKWRTNITAGQWISDDLGWVTVGGEFEHGGVIVHVPGESDDPLADARLIVGTAGNPELLDAIDALLSQYATSPIDYVPARFRNIAAAIIAADGRMSA